MKKVIIHPGCISCGTCQFVCPFVFTVTDRSRVNESADLEQHWQDAQKAAKACPVGVIQCKEQP